MTQRNRTVYVPFVGHIKYLDVLKEVQRLMKLFELIEVNEGQYLAITTRIRKCEGLLWTFKDYSSALDLNVRGTTWEVRVKIRNSK